MYGKRTDYTLSNMYMIEMYGATVASGDKEVATDISFIAGSGKRVAITGGDDNDKRTVLEALYGLAPLKAGWVCIDGEPLLPDTAKYFRKLISYMPLDAGLNQETVSQLVHRMMEFDANSDCIYSKKALLDEWKALNIDATCHDTPFCDIAPDTRQRIMLSLTGLFARPIALLHSPTSLQDADGRAAVMQYLTSARFADTATITATDDDELAAACDTIIHLNTEKA